MASDPLPCRPSCRPPQWTGLEELTERTAEGSLPAELSACVGCARVCMQAHIHLHRLSVNSGLSASPICPSSPHPEPSRALKGPVPSSLPVTTWLAQPPLASLQPDFLTGPALRSVSAQVLGRAHPWDARALAASSQRGLGPG